MVVQQRSTMVVQQRSTMVVHQQHNGGTPPAQHMNWQAIRDAHNNTASYRTPSCIICTHGHTRTDTVTRIYTHTHLNRYLAIQIIVTCIGQYYQITHAHCHMSGTPTMYYYSMRTAFSV
eukprot:Lankesteria_metandrocarpae@DN2075_c0_g1_i1.p1